MKDYLGWLVLCTLAICLSACQKDNISPEDHLVNFNSIKVGQQSKFILFKGEHYQSSADHSFTYFSDTLVVEVVARKPDGYFVREYLTPGSISLNGENHVAFADTDIFYYILKTGNVIAIKHDHFRLRSRLFVFPDENTFEIDLNQPVSPRVSIKGWKTNLPYSTNYIAAYLPEMELFGKSYKDLSVMVDNRPMKSKGSGITHIFNRRYGMVRVAQYAALTGQGFGWDLLPN